MSQRVREFFQAIKESRPVQEIAAELKQQASHGSHEMAAALFNGNGFVMYPRQPDREDPQHGPPAAQKEQEHQQERGGMEM
jgi:hypothetical protein